MITGDLTPGTRYCSLCLQMRLLEGNTFVYRFHSDIFVSVIDTKGKNEAELKEQIASYNRKIAMGIITQAKQKFYKMFCELTEEIDRNWI